MNYRYGKGVQKSVLCWEVVPLSEGPLSEVPLYTFVTAPFSPIIDWSSTYSPLTVHPFTHSSGPKCYIPERPVDIFNLFFSDNLVSSIVTETNRYAAQEIGSGGKQWRTTTEEIRAYFGFMILMGVNQLPEIRDYWSTNPALHYAPIADRISRDRFEEITRFLHFVDNSTLPARGHPSYSRLQKVAPVVKEVNEACRRLYYPHCQVSVDEAMIAFKGRSSMKQFVPKKPIKRGFKIWVLADALNGYFCNIIPYTGATKSSPVRGLGEKVVLELSKPYFGCNHHIYCDNFFTSVVLLRHLLRHQTYGCGTVRSDRKFLPTDIIKEATNLSRGGYSSRQDMNIPNLVATSWKDNKVVTVVSTMSSPEDTGMVSRKQKDGTRIDVPCPATVYLYNRYMGGVDRGDQLRKYYHFRMKSRKNYKYIFWFLVDVCITNSYILSHYHPTSTLPMSECTLKAFRLRLAEELIGSYKSRKRAGRPSRSSVSSASARQLPQNHMPARGKKRRCSFCKRSKVRHETIWYCETCPGMPPLCIRPRHDNQANCFKLWHDSQ